MSRGADYIRARSSKDGRVESTLIEIGRYAERGDGPLEQGARKTLDDLIYQRHDGQPMYRGADVTEVAEELYLQGGSSEARRSRTSGCPTGRGRASTEVITVEDHCEHCAAPSAGIGGETMCQTCLDARECTCTCPDCEARGVHYCHSEDGTVLMCPETGEGGAWSDEERADRDGVAYDRP